MRPAPVVGSLHMTTRARTYRALPTAPNFRGSQGESIFHFSSDNNPADFAFHVDLDQDMTVDVQEAGGDPKTLHEAPSHPDRLRWKEAMDREVETLEKAGTWISVTLTQQECYWRKMGFPHQTQRRWL